jgi:transposase
MSDSQRDELIEQLRAENAQLRKQLADALSTVARLEQENRDLRLRLEELEKAAARQAAPFRRPESKKVPAQQKKRPGRQEGHPGSYRRKPDYVDEEVEVPLTSCPCCGGAIHERRPIVQYIEEIPPIRPKVVRLTTWEAECATCGKVCSTHPLKTSNAQGAARVQLGPRALAVATLLNKHLGLTMPKTSRLLGKIFQLRITPGGLSQALDRIAERVAGSYDDLINRLRTSDAVFADETSWWVGGPGWWLWVFTNQKGTAYVVDQSRSGQVVRDVLGEEFRGMLVSDCLNSYDSVYCRKHKCIAHHLRAISNARDRPDTKDPRYLDEWKQFFKTVTYLYNLRDLLPPEDFVAKRAHLEKTCDQLVHRSVMQSGDIAVQNRLLKQWPHLLGCLYEPAAEPTNNRAERQLRPAVISRKLSCGNKTARGKRTWEILASIGATCQQTADDFVEFLAAKLPLPSHAG